MISFFYSSLSFAQGNTSQEIIEYVISQQPTLIEKFDPKEKTNTLHLQTSFNNAIYSKQDDLKSLNGKQIIKIELIYTTYRKSETFDQHTLNRKRLDALFKAVPGILTQGGIEWKLTGQTGCTSPEMGKEFFHGVSITYRPTYSEAMAIVERDFIRKVAKGDVPVHAYEAYVKKELKEVEKSLKDTLAEKEHVFHAPEFSAGERARIDYYTRNLKYPGGQGSSPQNVVVEFTIDKEGKVNDIQFPFIFKPNEYTTEVMRFLNSMPNWKPGILDSSPTISHIQQSIEFTERGSIIPSPIFSYSVQAPPKKMLKIPGTDYDKVRPTNASLAVVQTLQRNKWEKAALVVDVTGSMAQYNVQILEFLKNEILNKTNKYEQICFFNDGNGKSDRMKKVGQTGGIFCFPITNVDDVMDKMFKVMDAGDGGDIAENNIEALLKMQDTCSTCTSLVMVADNYATPRDLSLLTKVKLPVHVIVCTNSSVLNEAYLTIAYQTKGSVHFNAQDISNIHNFEEGATVQVLKETYVLSNGKFVRKRKK